MPDETPTPYASRAYCVTLTDEVLLSCAELVGVAGGPPTIEAFLQRAIGHALRANHHDVEDDAIEVEEIEDMSDEPEAGA